jgi:radical SAM superfamily enzyme YgiQ (UPF0313 family)
MGRFEMRATSLRVLLLSIGSPRQERNEPIGIDTLAAVLIDRFKESVDVRLWFGETDSVSAPEEIVNHRPDLIGISASIGNEDSLDKIVCQIALANDDRQPLIVVGGTLPTFVGEGVLLAHPEVICVVGEGEEALSCLVSLMIENDFCDPDYIKEMCVGKAVPNTAVMLHGKIHINRRLRSDLRTIPPPTRQFVRKILAQGGLVSIEASRGCSWSMCTFCGVGQKYGSNEWRPFPLERVVADIRRLAALGARKVYFTDEDFVGPNTERAIKLCDHIAVMKSDGVIPGDMSFFVDASVNTLLSPESPRRINQSLLARMKRAGIDEVFIGLESGSKSQLQRYGKNHTIDEARECVMALLHSGFRVDVGFIMFDPEMTLSELRENVEFCWDIGIYRSVARLSKRLRLTPYTKLARRLCAKSWVSPIASVDQAAFEYSFCSSAIQLVYNAYRKWEAEYLPIAYGIQRALRQENTAVATDALRERLNWLRCLDLMVLDKCAGAVERDGSEQTSKLSAICDEYLLKLREWVSTNM